MLQKYIGISYPFSCVPLDFKKFSNNDHKNCVVYSNYLLRSWISATTNLNLIHSKMRSICGIQILIVSVKNMIMGGWSEVHRVSVKGRLFPLGELRCPPHSTCPADTDIVLIYLIELADLKSLNFNLILWLFRTLSNDLLPY